MIFSGGSVGQDHSEGGKRRAGLQERQHQVLLLGRRRRPQVRIFFLVSRIVILMISMLPGVTRT